MRAAHSAKKLRNQLRQHDRLQSVNLYAAHDRSVYRMGFQRILFIKKNTEVLVVASKEVGLKLSAEKFKNTRSLLEIRMQDKIST
jgi:hypothetical protein